MPPACLLQPPSIRVSRGCMTPTSHPQGPLWWSKQGKLLSSRAFSRLSMLSASFLEHLICVQCLPARQRPPFDGCSHPLVEMQQSRAVLKPTPSSSPLPGHPRFLQALREGQLSHITPEVPSAGTDRVRPSTGAVPGDDCQLAWGMGGTCSSPCPPLGVCFAGPDPGAGGVK